MNINLHGLHLKANKLAYAQACEKNGVKNPQRHIIFNEYVEIFARLIVEECANICKEHGDSAEFSYISTKAVVAKKTAHGCAELMQRKLQDK